ncbi:hypothetical protein [Phaeobacter sp. C3_T13_0]|uniref:hypothetical protein n=1 Tax=Phaeobacter cretensis TaxID=3342641 RepID=UPI0039BD877D
MTSSPQSITPTLPQLDADCDRCAALCCVAYPFDASEDFAIIKETEDPCPNLSGSCFGCTIHDHLSNRGFGGCVAYSCAGAGQRVTQDLFHGETWRDDPDLISHMSHALRVLRPIHEALLILKEAAALPLPTEVQNRCQLLIAELCPAAPTSVWDFEEDSVQSALASVPEFIEGLIAFVPPRG